MLYTQFAIRRGLAVPGVGVPAARPAPVSRGLKPEDIARIQVFHAEPAPEPDSEPETEPDDKDKDKDNADKGDESGGAAKKDKNKKNKEQLAADGEGPLCNQQCSICTDSFGTEQGLKRLPP